MQRRPPPLELPFPRRSPASDGLAPRAPAREAAPREPSAVLSVGELDRRLKRIVEGSTGDLEVGGEVSGLKEVASGHAYFTLKDEREDASIECVMYRMAPPRARRLLTEGARVILVGRASVYVPRGRLQFTAENARPAGRGALLEALERLKEKLAAEGLFAPERKRRLPAEPRVIGVVTSLDGAAIHDIVKVASRRARVRILLARAPVQGPDAPVRMGRALAALCRVPEVDAIILGRGGGSADDLAAFNDEALVRQIAACRVPVISAVGHEIDVTLADLAADARAATPSQAAELVVPDAAARAQEVAHLRARLARAFRHRVASERAALQRTSARFASPARLLGERRQGLDEAREAMVRALRRAVAEGRGDVARLERRLLARHPSAVVAGARAALRPLRGRLDASERRHAGLLRARLSDLAARLDALSPLAVLGRGYSITAAPSGALVVDARDLSPGDLVHVRVHRGGFHASVLDTELASDASGAPGGSNTTGAPARPAKDGR